MRLLANASKERFARIAWRMHMSAHAQPLPQAVSANRPRDGPGRQHVVAETIRCTAFMRKKMPGENKGSVCPGKEDGDLNMGWSPKGFTIRWKEPHEVVPPLM